MKKLALVLALGAFCLASCHAVKTENRLILKVEPAELQPGVKLTVTAVPQPLAEMAYVSGTVAVSGAPVLPFKYNAAAKHWYFGMLIPALVSIPPGEYEVKVWGQSLAGARYEGRTTVKVK